MPPVRVIPVVVETPLGEIHWTVELTGRLLGDFSVRVRDLRFVLAEGQNAATLLQLLEDCYGQ